MLSWLVTIKNTSDIPHFEKFRVSTPIAEHAEDEYTIACLLFVFVAVSVPKLARSELSVYKASLEGKWLGAYCSQKQRVTAGCSWIWVSLASVKYEVQKVEGTWLCFRVEANTLNRHIPLSPPTKKERFTVRRTWSWAQNTKVRTKGNNFIDNLLSTSAVLSLATEKQKMKKISGVNINVKVFENVKYLCIVLESMHYRSPQQCSLLGQVYQCSCWGTVLTAWAWRHWGSTTGVFSSK